MKISIAQLNYHVGNFDKNICLITDAIDKAKEEGADIIVFSELCVCGYPPLDLLYREDFISKCEDVVTAIAQRCEGITAILGTPSRNNSLGKKLYNSAIAVSDGKILFTSNKSILASYGSFNEQKYFESNETFELFEFKGHHIAITICEDLWQENIAENNSGVSPISKIAQLHPDLIINIAATPFSHTEIVSKTNTYCYIAKELNASVIMANQTGANTDLIFDGGSMVVNKKGDIVKRLPFFEEATCTFDLEETTDAADVVSTEYDSIALMHDALVLGIHDYFHKTGIKNAILGLSGGIDSAIVLCLAVEALGNTNVRAVLMPSRYSSDHSISDSIALANNLDIQYDIVSIEKPFSAFEEILAPLFVGCNMDVTEENIQARSRAVILMAISNKFGNMLLNTSNKSEASVGYGTLYGDMAGGLSVIGDVYKTDVYRLSRYINRNGEVMPENIITKKPSAELRPDQYDSDSLPDYAILDSILYQYIELRRPAKEITGENIERATVDRVIKMVNRNEHKRYQFAPILRVSSLSYGGGRVLPIVGKI